MLKNLSSTPYFSEYDHKSNYDIGNYVYCSALTVFPCERFKVDDELIGKLREKLSNSRYKLYPILMDVLEMFCDVPVETGEGPEIGQCHRGTLTTEAAVVIIVDNDFLKNVIGDDEKYVGRFKVGDLAIGFGYSHLFDDIFRLKNYKDILRYRLNNDLIWLNPNDNRFFNRMDDEYIVRMSNTTVVDVLDPDVIERKRELIKFTDNRQYYTVR